MVTAAIIIRSRDIITGGPRYWVNWTGNVLLGLVAGYGGRTFRVLGCSVATIGGFAVVYWYYKMPIPSKLADGTAAGLPDYVIFSIQAFTTLFLPDPQPDPVTAYNFCLRFLSVLEALAGAFWIAVLVFALTRSIHR